VRQTLWSSKWNYSKPATV